MFYLFANLRHWHFPFYSAHNMSPSKHLQLQLWIQQNWRLFEWKNLEKIYFWSIMVVWRRKSKWKLTEPFILCHFWKRFHLHNMLRCKSSALYFWIYEEKSDDFRTFSVVSFINKHYLKCIFSRWQFWQITIHENFFRVSRNTNVESWLKASLSQTNLFVAFL